MKRKGDQWQKGDEPKLASRRGERETGRTGELVFLPFSPSLFLPLCLPSRQSLTGRFQDVLLPSAHPGPKVPLSGCQVGQRRKPPKSRWSHQVQAEQGLQALGFRMFLRKPVDHDRLISAVLTTLKFR